VSMQDREYSSGSLSSDFSPHAVPAEGESIYGRRARPDYKIDPETGCWNWLKAVLKTGYPSGRPYRLYYEATHGPIPKGWHIHHTCRNPRCLNPGHLEAIEQMAHVIEHRLHSRGLTIDDIKAIREVGKDPTITQYQLSAKYGLTPNNIWYIWTARHWSHLGGPVRPQGIKCANCGNEIPPEGQRHRKYCSPRCRSSASDKRNREKRTAYAREWRRRRREESSP
jgi:predicted nucleic acid-binding Zn ribbon protein